MAQFGITANSKDEPNADPSLSTPHPCLFLGKVPTEIRDIIYCYALVSPEIETILIHSFEGYLDDLGLESGQRSLPPVHVAKFLIGSHHAKGPSGNRNLLDTSRQIRQESLATFFRTTKLGFLDSEDLVKFFRTITPSCLELLTNISLHTVWLEVCINATHFAKGRWSKNNYLVIILLTSF